MDIFEATPSERARGGNTIALFLALYLLVLAFFILLVTISSVEKVKSNAVMDSLTSTFRSLVTPSTSLTAFQSKEGNIIAGQQFQQEVTDLFATTLQVARVEVVQPGRLMQVRMDAESLFYTDEARLREAHQPLYDRLVATLSSHPPGLSYDMEFLIGIAYDAEKGLPEGGALPMVRAAAFALEMESRGIPPQAIAIGILPENAGEVLMNFFVRDEEENRLMFGIDDAADDGTEDEATGDIVEE